MSPGPRGTLSLALAGLVVSSFAARVVHADETKDSCLDAYEQAQRLRKDGKLIDARAKLAICADDKCPAFTKTDCARWSGEVERATPAVTFTAKDAQGHDMEIVDVFVDGRRVLGRIDGRPMLFDPGPHFVRFVSRGSAVEQKVVLAEGDSTRRVEGVFAAPASAAPNATPGAPLPGPERSTSSRHVPAVSYVLGGVAAVGLASWIGFGLSALSAESCKPFCSQAQASTVHRDALIGDISWITGLAALGGAIYFAVSQPSTSDPAISPRVSSLRFDLRPVAGGAEVGASARFQ